MKKAVSFLLAISFILIVSLNAFAVSIPKVYVEAPNYVDAGEEFYITVEVRVDDTNRVDNIYIEKDVTMVPIILLPKPKLEVTYAEFGPFSIENTTTYKVVVELDDGSLKVIKYITVELKEW